MSRSGDRRSRRSFHLVRATIAKFAGMLADNVELVSDLAASFFAVVCGLPTPPSARPDYNSCMRARAGLLIAALLVLAGAALSQRFGGFGFGGRAEGPRPEFPNEGEFHFIRLEYNDDPRFHRGFGFASRGARGTGWWIVDWPDSDDHFTMGVRRLTRIAIGEPRHFALTDDRIWDHPWIYATQTGWWGLSNIEIARLREYLLRGGFLVTDDMWGDEAWEVFRSTMDRVFPGQPINDIALGDAVMHVLYDIEQKDLTWIPGTRHLRIGYGGVSLNQPPGTKPAWRALYDDHQRMVVAVNYDTDIGDAWEYADAPEYPEAMTALAYRYGINYLVYSMTH
jgi:hypothetical protein